MVKPAGNSATDKRARGSIVLTSGLSKDLFPIGHEAPRIHESAMYSSQSQFEQAELSAGNEAD